MNLDIKIKMRALPFVMPVSAGTIEGTPAGQPGSPTGPGVQAPPAESTGFEGATNKWTGINLELPGVTKLVDKLNDALKKLDTIIDIAKAILKVIEFFITSFSSFASLLKAAIDGLNSQIDDFVKNLKSTGVYLNFFVPPAFYRKNSFGASTYTSMSTGGFEGFLSRLQGSFYQNTIQPIPTTPLVKTFFSSPSSFTPSSQVGGMVIMADANSLDDFYRAINALSNFISSLDLFGVDFTPQPPTNLRGTCGPSASDPKILSVLLEWDPPAVNSDQWLYRIYRDTSLTNEKHMKVVSDLPRRLGDNKDTGEKGLITVIKKMFAKGLSAIPQKLEYEYKDDAGLFTPVTVMANSFLDTKLDYTNNPDGTFNIKTREYFYVVETVSVFTPSQKSVPYRVVIKGCQDAATTSSIISHGNGIFEKIGPNAPGQYPWMSFRPLEMVPAIDLFANTLKKALTMISGMIMSVTNSFSEYAKALVKKIESYISLIGIIKTLLDALIEIFKLPPGIYFIMVTPEAGGLENFMTRLRNAAPPEGVEFSGPTGITAGAVMLYGAPSAEELTALNASFGLIFKILGGRVEVSSSGQVSAKVAPTISSGPVSITVQSGETATFSVTASGGTDPNSVTPDDPLLYQWQKNGVNISGATLNTYTTPETILIDTGSKFRCIISNKSGSITSEEATLTVRI